MVKDLIGQRGVEVGCDPDLPLEGSRFPRRTRSGQGDQPRHGLPCLGDDDLLTGLHLLDERGEIGLCFMNVDLRMNLSLAKSGQADMGAAKAPSAAPSDVPTLAPPDLDV
jgi:hypothetical protein